MASWEQEMLRCRAAGRVAAAGDGDAEGAHATSDRSLPTVAALQALWNKVAEKPLYAPPNFWRYVRLRWRTRLRLVDPGRVPLVFPPGKINDCSGCLHLCCIGAKAAVSLRLRDIATLVDLQRTDLMTHEKPRFGARQLEQQPALRRHVASLAWQTFPVLRQNAFGACLALSAAGRCTLYPHWPLSCGRFPYAFHAVDGDLFYSQRCDSFWIDPAKRKSAEAMAVKAVASYNERIKDLILLAYAPRILAQLGLLKFLRLKRQEAV